MTSIDLHGGTSGLVVLGAAALASAVSFTADNWQTLTIFGAVRRGPLVSARWKQRAWE